MKEKELKRKVRVTLSLMVSFFIVGTIGYAEQEQTTVIGENAKASDKESVAIGKKAEANGDESVAIGKETKAEGKGSVAIGDKASIVSNGSELTSIAIGKNAMVLNGTGKQEALLSFTPDNYEYKFVDWSLTVKFKDLKKVPGGIAIGTNSYARTASVQLGNHTMSGYKMGDSIITNDTNNSEASLVGMTTIGTNTYNKGMLASMLGAYSVITGNYNGRDSSNGLKYGFQNFGASVIGSLNSIRSYSDKRDSSDLGIANSIVGLANIAEKSNGTLIYGAGNTVKNSYEDIKNGYWNTDNVDTFVDSLHKTIKEGKSGGATLVIGGGNEAEYTKQVTMIGTSNTVKGESSKKKSSLIMLAGDKNEITNSSNIIAYGSNFKILKSNNILFGFNTKFDLNTKKNIVNIVEKEKVVAIGNNIKVSDDNSVYLGHESGSAGGNNSLWNEETKNKNVRENYYKEYKNFAGFAETGGIVSIGNEKLTRVIQNVAPGLISQTSTDAINGSQLYHFINKGITIVDGKGKKVEVKLGDTFTLRGNTVEVTHKESELPKIKLEGNKPSETKKEEKEIENKVVEDKIVENKSYTMAFEVSQKLQNKIDEIDKRSNLALSGISNTVAMANLVQLNLYSKYRHNLSAAYGYYGGSHALAIGFSGTNEKRNFIYKLSGAVNNKGNLALGIGAGIMLGNKEDDYPVKSDKIKKLSNEVDELKKSNEELRRENREIKELLQKVLNKNK